MASEATPPLPDLPALQGRRFSIARRQDIQSEPARILLEWWENVARQHPPTLRDFDVAEHARIATNLFIIELVDDAFELKLCGEEFVRLIQRKRGMRWRESDEDEIARDYAIFLGTVSRNKRPYLGSGPLVLDGRVWVAFESITCPLLADNGQTSVFIGSVCAIDKGA